jgi:hypothetical protein
MQRFPVLAVVDRFPNAVVRRDEDLVVIGRIEDQRVDVLVNRVAPRVSCRHEVDPGIPTVGRAIEADIATEDHVLVRRIDRDQAADSALTGLETGIRLLGEGVAAINARKNLVRHFHSHEIRAVCTFETEGDFRTVDGSARRNAGGKQLKSISSIRAAVHAARPNSAVLHADEQTIGVVRVDHHIADHTIEDPLRVAGCRIPRRSAIGAAMQTSLAGNEHAVGLPRIDGYRRCLQTRNRRQALPGRSAVAGPIHAVPGI